MKFNSPCGALRLSRFVSTVLLLALFVAPLVATIPIAATAPALILVGSLMISAVTEIEWADPMVAVPAIRPRRHAAM